MSLAEELLADLESDGEDETMETEEQAELDDQESTETEFSKNARANEDFSNSSVKDVAKLFHSERLKDILSRFKILVGNLARLKSCRGLSKLILSIC